MRSSPDTIREYEPGDEAALLQAFNETNATVDPGFEARTNEEWRWRFLENPAGTRVTLALDGDGRVLAQYAGSPQRMRLDGVWVHVTQAIDSFSVTSTRGLGRSGTFVRTAELFAQLYGGRTDAGDPWMWGFPVPAARGVGQNFLGYEPMRSHPLLELSARTSLESGPTARDFGEGSLHAAAHEFQELFHRRAEGPWVLADRCANALDWRYRRHPTRRYRIGIARSSEGDLCGFAVYRGARFEGRQTGLICDWLADPEAEGALVRWALECAREQGVDRLVHLLPPACGSFEALQELGFRVRPSSLMLVGRSYDRAYPLSFWSRRWYYTLGDTDLC